MANPTKINIFIVLFDTWLEKIIKKFWKWLWATNKNGWYSKDNSKWKRPGLMLGITILIFQIPGIIKGLSTIDPACAAWFMGLVFLPLIAAFFLFFCYWLGRAVYLLIEQIKVFIKWLKEEWSKAEDKINNK